MNYHILKVDIECTNCGRLMALSNSHRHHHQYLCPRCAPSLDQLLKEIHDIIFEGRK